jgi:hypothetical protein
VTDLKTGAASLGVLRPNGTPRLRLDRKPDGREVVRMQLADGTFRLDLSVSDLRLYADDGGRPDTARVGEIARRIERGVPLLLGVGLTRPFATGNGEEPVHWLQVNNLHLEDDPAWRLASSIRPGSSSVERQLVTAGSGMSNLADEELPF